MKEYKKQVSIIIVNYNTKELTRNTIQSVIDKTSDIEYEIIVVDNDSKDGSLEELKKTFQNKITIIESKENLGFGRANNLGIKKSTGKYVFLLNSDTELINNAIKIFYDYMEENDNVGVCGGNLYNVNYVPEDSYVMHRDTIFSFFYWRYLELLFNAFSMFTKKVKYCRFNYSKKIKEVGLIIGADMFIRKSVLVKTGLFDENIFMYAEDTDLNFRIRNAGYSIMSVPQAKIFHYSSRSSSNEVKKYSKSLTGIYYTYFKYFGKRTLFIYLDIKLTMLRKALTSMLLLKKERAKIYLDIIKINKEKYFEQKNKYLQINNK